MSGGEHTINEMSEELAQSRAKRGGNRTILTKLANEAHGLPKDEVLNPLKTLAQSLVKKLKIVKSLDEVILEMCKVEDIELEIEKLYEINERALEIRRRIMDAIAAVETGPDKSDNKLVEIMCPWCPLNGLLFLEINTQM